VYRHNKGTVSIGREENRSSLHRRVAEVLAKMGGKIQGRPGYEKCKVLYLGVKYGALETSGSFCLSAEGEGDVDTRLP